MNTIQSEFDVSSPALERLFETSEVPLALTSAGSADAPLLMVNDAFLKLTGYERDEVIGRNCRFLQGPDTEPDARLKLKMAVNRHTESLVRIRNYRKDGTPFDNYVFLRPIYAEDGKMIYILGSQYGFDLSERASDPLQHAEFLEEQIELSQKELLAEGLSMPQNRSCSSSVLRSLIEDA